MTQLFSLTDTAVLKIKNSVASRVSYGGTAPTNVMNAVKEAKKRFLKD